jgi:hypothetical protein
MTMEQRQTLSRVVDLSAGHDPWQQVMACIDVIAAAQLTRTAIDAMRDRRRIGQFGTADSDNSSSDEPTVGHGHARQVRQDRSPDRRCCTRS